MAKEGGERKVQENTSGEGGAGEIEGGGAAAGKGGES